MYTVLILLFFTFFFSCFGAHRDLHSFPTRRSSDLLQAEARAGSPGGGVRSRAGKGCRRPAAGPDGEASFRAGAFSRLDRKSTRLNSSHPSISYAVFCLKKKKTTNTAQAGYKPETYS